MWCLARLSCPNSHGDFYGVLAEGHGTFAPALISADRGDLVQGGTSRWDAWFATWLKEAYQARQSSDIPVRVVRRGEFRPKALLVNCLDSCYGHCLPKLLSVQHDLDHRPDYGVIVIVPRSLEWLIPDGVMEAWVVDAPLGILRAWHDLLAAKFSDLASRWNEVWIADAPTGVHAAKFDICRFTRVTPFGIDGFRAVNAPTITFIWREDRLVYPQQNVLINSLHRAISRVRPNLSRRLQLKLQVEHVVRLGMCLQSRMPDVDFAVVGIGSPTSGSLPSWMRDMRSAAPDELTERVWCRRYAESHLVVGVHGSNMMLPSAHAGAVLTLMPTANQLYLSFSDTILNNPRAVHPTMSTLLRYRMVPVNTGTNIVAEWIVAMVESFWTLTGIWNVRAVDGIAS
jgi:hypothetical protein